MDFAAYRDKCAIAGIGSTEFSRDSGRSVLTLATEATLAALADCGLGVDDVDAIVRCESDEVAPNALAASLGARNLSWWAETGPGGVAPCAMIGLAIGAVLSGQAKTVIAFRSLNGRSGARLGAAARGPQVSVVGGRGTYEEYYLPQGLMTAGQVFALMAQRHMYEYGTTQEQLGAIALTCRENANSTPHAEMRDRPLDMAAYLASRPISTPLRLFDFCLESDGACAVVITSTERARDLRQRPALIRGVAQRGPGDIRGGTMFPDMARRDITELPARRVSELLWSRAGLGPRDIDVAQVYDCFTISILLQLEAYGFCGAGEGGPFAESGAIRRDGSIPINTAGGHMSEGYIHGMNHIVEAVRQMRGTSAVQIADAETCLVTGGPLPYSSGLVLRKAA